MNENEMLKLRNT